MNVMYFIIPKCDVAFVYDDFNVRQVLEKIEYYKLKNILLKENDYDNCKKVEINYCW